MCIFCKIVNGEIPSYKIYEDNNVIAFLDISQATIGHTLVVPKKHFSNILDLDEETLINISKVVKIVTKKLSFAFNIKNFNIINNMGEIAGQTVEHFHIHIIPRTINDKFSINFPHNELTQDEFNNLLDKIKAVKE